MISASRATGRSFGKERLLHRKNDPPRRPTRVDRFGSMGNCEPGDLQRRPLDT